jgi:hypothetical protein
MREIGSDVGVARPSPFPADPVANGAAHEELEIMPPKPRQIFGKQRHAMTSRAGHARDVGPPEPARWSERFMNFFYRQARISMDGKNLSESRR